MYPRNAASPERVDIGAVVQISDGAVQTSGCTVRIIPAGGAEGDGAGTTAYSTDGVVLYTPTQAETNYTSFILVAKKAGCIPASKTVVTSANATAGKVTVGSNEDKTGYTASTVSDKTGYSLAEGHGLALESKQDTILGYVDCLPATWVVPAAAGAAMTLTADYDAAKTAAQAGDAMTLTAAYDAAKTAATQTSVNAIATVLTGITSLAAWLRGMFRKSAMDATAKSEVNTGGGTFDEATDSLEAVRDTEPLGTAMRGTDSALLASGYTAPPTAAAIADAVLDETIAEHANAGSVGQAISAAGGAADPLLNPVPGAYAEGTAGYVIGTNLDAKVSEAGGSGSVHVTSESVNITSED